MGLTDIQEAHIVNVIGNVIAAYPNPVEGALAGFLIGMGIGVADPEVGESLLTVAPALLQTGKFDVQEQKELYGKIALSIRNDTL